VVVVVALAAVGLAVAGRLDPGLAMAVVAVGAWGAWVVARRPVLAVVLLLTALFLRGLPEFSALPVQPHTLALLGVLGATAVAALTGALPVPRLGRTELLMACYLGWNALSLLTPHAFSTDNAATGLDGSARGLVQFAVVVPFLLYLVGRMLGDRERLVRAVLWTVLGLGGYSALVSILQFTGPARLVWPRYIVDSPGWHGVRAVGVFNQPVENGLVVLVGLAAAGYLAGRPGAGRRDRLVAALFAPPALVAVYLTHTRAVYLALVLVLVLGAWALPRLRTLLLCGLLAAALFVGATWQAFSSDDRAAGGVASTRELDDRLNLGYTALWAVAHEPLTGWGLGRFSQVNTVHHQQWSPDIDWFGGYGYAAHDTELAVAAELGVVGVGLWVALLAGIVVALVRSVRTRPGAPRAPAELALVAVAAWLVVGTTVDSRYLGFSTAVVFLLAGLGRGAR
jgi:O-antigen ligase